MSTVTLTDISHRYPSAVTPTVSDVSFHVSDGEFFVLLGPSGSGKSTILRMIHGLEKPASGSVVIDGLDVTRVLPNERDVTLAFENYALYPHMTVAENMGFALRLAGVAPADVAERVAEAAARLGLTEVIDAKPDDLDGTQRQKVALARALVRSPKVFVMDEPLANLPQELRDSTRDQIRTLQQELGITTIYATTEVVDALAVADRIATVEHGRITAIHTSAEYAALHG